jgi:glucokinase
LKNFAYLRPVLSYQNPGVSANIGPMAVIAMDLGGTKLAGAIFSANGKPIHKLVTPLDGRSGSTVGKLLCDTVKELLAASRNEGVPVSAVGVCVPGISHAKTGKVWAPNIPGWGDYPLRRELSRVVKAQGIPVVIDSDRACYILGETWRGAARGCRNAIFLAVGTGIGAGILMDGQILRGAHDSAGAIGWLALDRPFQEKYVACGCFEYHASGEGLGKVARELGLPPSDASDQSDAVTAHDVFVGWERGDVTAQAVLQQAISFWGMAVANLVSLFNPEKIVFGGGVFGPAQRFLGEIYTEAKQWAQPIAIQQVKLEPSHLGSDAGLYGAGYLALQAVGAAE